jgi:hypothetical protein
MITTERFRQRLYEAASIDHKSLRRWLTETGIGVGVAQTILPKDMSGRDSIPSAEKLAAIAAVTGRSVDWLLGLDEQSLGQMHAARAAAGGQAGDFAYIPRRDGAKTALSLAIGLPREWVEENLRAHPRDMTAAIVPDDAMAPTVRRGDMVLVDCSLKETPDGLYLIDVRGDVRVRRLQQIGERVHLLCDDARFPPLVANAPDITMMLYAPDTSTTSLLGYIVGRVVGVVSAVQ